MSRLRYCPTCEADISDTYESADPSTGITTSGWYCAECDSVVEDDDQDFESGEVDDD